MEPQKPKYQFTAVYTGRRLVNGKVWHRFERTDGGREMFFSGIFGLIIGMTYQCGDKTISQRPERTDAA